MGLEPYSVNIYVIAIDIKFALKGLSTSLMKKNPTKLQCLGLWQQTQAATVEPQNTSCSKTSIAPAERGESDTVACFWVSSLFMNILDIIKKKLCF